MAVPGIPRPSLGRTRGAAEPRQAAHQALRVPRERRRRYGHRPHGRVQLQPRDPAPRCLHLAHPGRTRYTAWQHSSIESERYSMILTARTDPCNTDRRSGCPDRQRRRYSHLHRHHAQPRCRDHPARDRRLVEHHLPDLRRRRYVLPSRDSLDRRDTVIAICSLVLGAKYPRNASQRPRGSCSLAREASRS